MGFQKKYPETTQKSDSTKESNFDKRVKKHTSLNDKLDKDANNYELLMKQPGKSKREEFLRDSVAKEYYKTTTEKEEFFSGKRKKKSK